jgi:hypothetical protein
MLKSEILWLDVQYTYLFFKSDCSILINNNFISDLINCYFGFILFSKKL